MTRIEKALPASLAESSLELSAPWSVRAGSVTERLSTTRPGGSRGVANGVSSGHWTTLRGVSTGVSAGVSSGQTKDCRLDSGRATGLNLPTTIHGSALKMERQVRGDTVWTTLVPLFGQCNVE